MSAALHTDALARLAYSWMRPARRVAMGSDSRAEEIAQRIMAGEAVVDVACDVGLTGERVRQICRKRGIAFSSNPSRMRLAKREKNKRHNVAIHERRVEIEGYYQTLADKAAELRAAGMTWQAIGAALMMPVMTILRLTMKRRPEVRTRTPRRRPKSVRV